MTSPSLQDSGPVPFGELLTGLACCTLPNLSQLIVCTVNHYLMTLN